MYDIPGFSKYYLSEELKVHNKQSGNVLEGSVNTGGYLMVSMINDQGEKTSTGLHRIIATCLIEKPELIVNHIDNNKLNNIPSNLEWVTSSENRKHSFSLGNVDGNCFVQVKDNQKNEILFFHSMTQCAKHFNLHRTTVQARCAQGDRKVFPGGFQFRSPASKEPFPEITDIDRALLSFGTQKSILVKNLVTQEVMKFDMIGMAAQFMGIAPGTINGHFSRNDHPVVRDIYQIKMELDPRDWLAPVNLCVNTPVEVFNNNTKETKIYESAVLAARDNGIKPTALNYRLSQDPEKVWSDGKKYRKV